MKKTTYAALLASLLILVAKCSMGRVQTLTPTPASREGIFQEITTTEETPPGFADVVIKASLKTHLPGEGSLLEFIGSPHGGEFYHFVLNVGGQEAIWNVPGQLENNTVDGDANKGLGMKYTLEKKIRLRAGRSTLSLGFPEENYTRTLTVNLQGGNSYTLEFRPQYLGSGRNVPSFKDGFLGFSTLLKDTPTI